MLFNVKCYLTLASLFVVVVSQTPSQCVLDCGQAALQSVTNTSCTAITDTCVCIDMGFLTTYEACLQANCTAADQAAAVQAQQLFCGGAGNTTSTASGTETSSATGTASMNMTASETMTMSGNMTSKTATPSTGSGTGASSAASPSKSSGAGPQAEFGFFTLGVAAAGAVVGGLFI